MDHEQWATAAAPVAAAVAAALVLLIGTAATGLNAALKAWLTARIGAAQSQVVTDAAGRMQNAILTEVGTIGLEIAAGKLDVTNLDALKARAAVGEAAILAKLPDAVATLKPLEGAIAQGIVGKLGLSMIPAIAPTTGAAA